MTDRPTFVLETFIKTTPERLWEALTKPEMTALYYFGTRVVTDLKLGGPFQYLTPDGNTMLDGEILEIEPLRRIVTTFVPKWEASTGVSRVTFAIEPMGEVCKFTITHHDVDLAPGGVSTGWAQIASSLKSLL